MRKINRRQFIQLSSLTVGATIITACQNNQTETKPTATPSDKLDKITFGTDWFAQAEHGGFYQAVATGIYRDHGLDVTIKMGGPQVNRTQLLVGGAVDFVMGASSETINAVGVGIPQVTVAAIFQKTPQVLMAHPPVKNDTIENLKGKPIYVSSSAHTTYWLYLKSKYGFTDDQKRPYNFSVTPFLTDKNSAQQGFLTSEPLQIKKKGGFEPVIFLLADYGFNPYGTTIDTRREVIEKNPDLVQRFVDASIKGWYSYLGNPAPANELIKRDNPQMTDEQLAYSLDKLKQYGIIISGDAETKGIGAMTAERWQTFYNDMAAVGVFKEGVDYTQGFNLNFINKGVDYYKDYKS